jgi:hypothetical protein
MMSDIEPVAAPGALIPVAANPYDEKAFAKIAAAANYLPRLQLFGSNSDAVKEGTFPMGHYGLVKDKDVIDLGAEVDVLVIQWRPKAIDTGSDPVVAYHNPDSPAFQKLQERADQPNSGCMYGPEYLVYLPKVQKFATFLMGSKTARREAPNVKALLGKAASLSVKLIKNTSYSWHGPVCKDCSTPFEIPDLGEIADVTKTFLSPPETVVEQAPEAAGSTRAR